ncbi:MAG: hypothetical protein P8L77_05585, partial [Gammaproteobacteria bacterium]|nr:hypothetical protein [Gammaproteobacteria bacterium]
LVIVICTNAANTLHYVTRTVPSTQSAKMAGCANLVYKTSVFIIGLPVTSMLPQKTTAQMSSSDLTMLSMYFVFLSLFAFVLMLYLCLTEKTAKNQSKIT